MALVLLEGAAGLKLGFGGFLRGSVKVGVNAKAPAPPACPARPAGGFSLHMSEGFAAVRSLVSTCMGRQRRRCTDLKAKKEDGQHPSWAADCRDEAADAAMNPAARGLALAVVLVVGVLRYAVGLWDRLVVLFELLALQMRYIHRPLGEQYHIWSLLLLDQSRRLTLRREARAGNTGRITGGWLPHVDNLVGKWKLGGKKKGMAMGGQGPVYKDIVLLGGGHAHAYVLKNFGMNKMDGVRVTLITRDVDTPYSGMLPGHVAGLYTKEECHIDLGRICAWAGIRMIHAEATGIDTVAKQVLLAGGRPPISYDVLSVNIGSSPSLGSVPKDSEALPVTPVKPIDGFS
eukprot:CAMPEP_0206234694 /NCGR_PEP_ID=MMETSP0047_2-20121206/12729_1 /ASSEMBLY_ACC=CAM_ASM_000192 /TAXON_ID=195065 /ORGANISM="Chroomonas mesostigmatica_cf, Strain CCMP1168" /LENGTH=344 /DNA_ID=CAMNT_0053658801 /DNA_START=1 /DNA_END=1032 /DNA_ORIENTATION=-